MLTIKRVNNRSEKKNAIQLCDDSFPEGLCKRKDFNEVFEKIEKYACFFIAYDGENIAGYAAMYNNNFKEKNAYITMIGVRDIYQRNHIGSNLLKACVESAQDQGMNAIRLEVLKTNTKAIRFYKNQGFEFEKEGAVNSMYMILDIRD